MDIIVVFGSVPSRAYQPLRLAMLRKNLRPKIVRFDDEEKYQLFSNVCADIESELMDLDEPDFDVRCEQYASELFTRAFDSSEMMAAVKAVVVPGNARLAYDSSDKWEWAMELLPDKVAHYTAHKSESDDSFWLSGASNDKFLPAPDYA